MDNIKKLFPIPKWPHADPTPAALRWMIFTNKDGFSDHCVVRRGRRVLIDENKYFEWLEEQNQVAER